MEKTICIDNLIRTWKIASCISISNLIKIRLSESLNKSDKRDDIESFEKLYKRS